VRRALSAVFGGAGRQGYGEPGVAEGEGRLGRLEWPRSLAEESIIRVILDGTVVRVRLDRKATSIVLLVVLGVREDGQKVLLAVKKHGWRDQPRLGAPSSTISSRRGAAPARVPELSTAGAGWSRRWPGSGATCRPNAARFTSTATCLPTPPNGCMRRSSADYNDMIYAALGCGNRGAADGLSSANGGSNARPWPTASRKLAIGSFTFTRLPADQWKSARTTNCDRTAP